MPVPAGRNRAGAVAGARAQAAVRPWNPGGFDLQARHVSDEVADKVAIVHGIRRRTQGRNVPGTADDG